MKNQHVEFFWYFRWSYSNTNSQSWSGWVFWKKSYFEVFKPKGATIGPNVVFQVLWKIDAENISGFLQKVTVAYKLKLELSRFFGKNLALRFLGQKRPNMCPKWGFSGIIKSQSMELF